MAHVDRRCVDVPPELIAQVHVTLREHGPRRAAARLGISRSAVLSIIGTGRAMPGTVALLRQALTTREAA